MKTEIKLVKKAQKGDHTAFFSLMKNYEVRLYNLAKRFLHNEYDIADVLQETTISAYENLNQLKQPQYFYTWLCKILINKCKALLLKNSKVSIGFTYENLTQNASSQKLDFELSLTLENLLDELKDTYKIPLVLYYYNGFSVKEISEILNEPVGTIKSKLSRGRNLIKKELKKQEVFHEKF